MRPGPFVQISAGALVVRADREVLMVRHRPSVEGIWQGTWIFPGGGIRVGERVEEAVHREVLEETRVRIELLRQLWPLERIHPPCGRPLLHVIYLTYLARHLDGEPSPGDDVGEARWAPLASLTCLRAEIHEDAWRLIEMAGFLPIGDGPRFLPQ